MALVLEANYSKKLGLPGYSSHQYGVTIRAELNDIKQVPEETARLYQLLQSSVDKEIQQSGWLPDNSHAAKPHESPENEWACSEKQRELILKVIDENQVDKHEVENLSHERFGKGVKELNRLEASGLIDELLEQYGGKRSSGSRKSGYRRNSYARNGGGR